MATLGFVSTGLEGLGIGLLTPRHIGVAGQDLELVDGTIADNIAYGVPDASEKEISEAARLDAEQFIIGLPQGYQTRVGGRGLGLSGGQRLRIGLARA